VVAVRLTAPEDTLRERLSKPRQGWSEADVAVYERMRERPRPFTIPVVVVDTRFDTGPSVDLAITLVTQDE
jgi:predicted kinase